MSDTAYVIVNEFQPIGSESPTMEIISVHLLENEAWQELSDMALDFDMYLPGDDNSFSVEPDSHLEYDEYLIMEFPIGRNENNG